MAADNDIKYGTLNTRDLVQLYYAGRMTAFSKNTQFLDISNVTQLMTLDPRRIKYELYISDAIGAGGSIVVIGTEQQVAQTLGLQISVANLLTLPIKRDFFADLDTVCEALWANFIQGAFSISVRETILTPLAVDDTP